MKIGDLFAINTPDGIAYLHYIYKDKTIGSLIRVLEGLYLTPPDLDRLVASKEKYLIYFPLSAALKKKIIVRVGYYPTTQSKPKYMRSEYKVKGKALGWHIVDTDSWKREHIQELSTEQKQLSPWGIWNDTLLIERLVSNWNLSDWN